MTWRSLVASFALLQWRAFGSRFFSVTLSITEIQNVFCIEDSKQSLSKGDRKKELQQYLNP